MAQLGFVVFVVDGRGTIERGKAFQDVVYGNFGRNEILDHAAALYQRGLAPLVLVTGGVGTGDTVSESEVGRHYLVKAGLPDVAVLALPAGTSTSASLDGVARWFSGRDSRRVLLVSDGFHMLRLQIIATRLGLVPFTSPAPNSPIRANLRRNAAYFFAEGFKVPVTWLLNR